MNKIVDIFGVGFAALVAMVGLPARRLTAFMDDVDEVWVVDAFLDQSDGFNLRR